MAKLSNSKGPWSLAALVPYGIGARRELRDKARAAA